MSQGLGRYHGTHRSLSDQSRLAVGSSSSETSKFRLPMIVPQPTTTNDVAVSVQPPPGRSQPDIIPQPALPSVAHNNSGSVAWNSHCTPSASLGTGTLTYAVITIAIRLRHDYDTTTIRLRSDYDVSRAPASNSTQAKNEHVNFSS